MQQDHGYYRWTTLSRYIQPKIPTRHKSRFAIIPRAHSSRETGGTDLSAEKKAKKRFIPVREVSHRETALISCAFENKCTWCCLRYRNLSTSEGLMLRNGRVKKLPGESGNFVRLRGKWLLDESRKNEEEK